jgi:hypothetical protein
MPLGIPYTFGKRRQAKPDERGRTPDICRESPSSVPLREPPSPEGEGKATRPPFTPLIQRVTSSTRKKLEMTVKAFLSAIIVALVISIGAYTVLEMNQTGAQKKFTSGATRL